MLKPTSRPLPPLLLSAAVVRGVDVADGEPDGEELGVVDTVGDAVVVVEPDGDAAVVVEAEDDAVCFVGLALGESDADGGGSIV